VSGPSTLAVEFVGLPGAGKSTVAALVRAALGAEIIIHDEGLVQNLWSVLIDSDGWSEGAMEGALDAVAYAIPPGFRFVYFDLDVGTALARIRRRRGQPSRFDGMTPPAAGRLLRTQRRQLEWILERTLERTGAPCLRLDAARDPDAMTREVLDFVEGAVALRK
jgi:thymidylate kinase